jgi:hypothetical protein
MKSLRQQKAGRAAQYALENTRRRRGHQDIEINISFALFAPLRPLRFSQKRLNMTCSEVS